MIALCGFFETGDLAVHEPEQLELHSPLLLADMTGPLSAGHGSPTVLAGHELVL